MIPLKETKAKILQFGLSTEELQYQLRTCNQLLAYYKRRIPDDNECVLCKCSETLIRSHYATAWSVCNICPWDYFEGKPCIPWHKEVYPNEKEEYMQEKRWACEPEFCARRVVMLSKWIRRYNAILKERLTNERS